MHQVLDWPMFLEQSLYCPRVKDPNATLPRLRFTGNSIGKGPISRGSKSIWKLFSFPDFSESMFSSADPRPCPALDRSDVDEHFLETWLRAILHRCGQIFISIYSEDGFE